MNVFLDFVIVLSFFIISLGNMYSYFEFLICKILKVNIKININTIIDDK